MRYQNYTHLKYYIPGIWGDIQNLNEEAKSKAQRRLFGMALAYKRGELDDKYVNDDIKKLSKLSVKKLQDFAKTNEKKRKKDGTIGKRNNLPNYTRDGKDFKTKP